ncbi:MAG TPA: hypothetical protein DCE80_18950 [Ignavibacteriales bacterium]|nr:hypothetical protein [Ignavibacteriales bacterium]
MKKTLQKLLPIFIPFGLAIITFLVYFPSLYYAFQFDDEPSILNFYHIRHKTFSDLFFSSSRWVSYWLNTIHYKLSQFEPFVYRRTNVFFHCLTGVLIFILLSSLLKLRAKESWLHKYNYLIAGLTSGLFLLHPVQTQTVSYVIQGQLEGLSAFFCFAIAVCFFYFTQVQSLILKVFLTLLITSLCVIGCGTKEITIILPFLIPLIDWFFIAQGNWHALKKRIWLYILIATTIWGCYLWLLGKNFFINVLSLSVEHQNTIGNIINPTGEKITTWPFFISQFKVILHYLFMFIWPFNICVDYDWKICGSVNTPDCILPLIGLLIIGLTILFALKKNRISLYAFGMLWFFICMAPRSTIMPSTELLADYKTYLASFGWLFVITIFLIHAYSWLMKKYSFLKNQRIIISVIMTGIAALSIMTYQRNKVWRSGLEFWHDIIQKSPTKARGYNNYGIQLIERDDIKNAIWCFKHAIQLEPYTYPDPYNNLSAAYAIQNQFDLAIKALRASLKINPGQPRSYNNLGLYLRKQGEEEWAERSYQQAILINPHYGKAYYNLGKLYVDQNRMTEAHEAFKNACTQADYDSHIEALQEYGHTSMHCKKYSDAIQAYTTLCQLQPNNIENTQTLADAYLMNQEYNEALQQYQHIKQINPYDTQLNCNMIECLIQLKQPENSLSIIDKLEQQSQKYRMMSLHKARALYMLGDIRRAQLELYDALHYAQDRQIKHLAQQILQQIEKEEK